MNNTYNGGNNTVINNINGFKNPEDTFHILGANTSIERGKELPRKNSNNTSNIDNAASSPRVKNVSPPSRDKLFIY